MKNFKHEKKYISNHHHLAKQEAIEEINLFLAGSATMSSDDKAKHEIAEEEHNQTMVNQTALLRRLMAKSYPWLVHSQQLENVADYPR